MFLISIHSREFIKKNDLQCKKVHNNRSCRKLKWLCLDKQLNLWWNKQSNEKSIIKKNQCSNKRQSSRFIEKKCKN